MEPTRDVCSARILIFDEPTAHLDPDGAASLQRRLAALAQEGGPGVLVITHELHTPDVFDEVLDLRDGRVFPRDEALLVLQRLEHVEP